MSQPVVSLILSYFYFNFNCFVFQLIENKGTISKNDSEPVSCLSEQCLLLDPIVSYKL